MERASLKFVLLFILLVFTSSVLRSVEAAKCVRDIDCYFQCRSRHGFCNDKTHKCSCLPREENFVESTADCTRDGGCN
ncbi:hypothetical protein DKX38_027860 [Salix brachista]|uniref:Uncharacterized protein n=1 Tax=Salix brachista TaxID=2182728 RepID=A0A5N5J837_9ROSI|nr:hypothetical protein DKX38_027860 [Salix brachista]